MFISGSGFRMVALLTGAFISTIPGSARGLTAVTSSLFSGSGNCAFCHDQWSGALLDSEGNNVSITGDWRATMMAHAFVDPFWRARMEAEVADHPEQQGFIEDKCLTCHAPMARTQFRLDEGMLLSIKSALAMELAHDGVSCTLCHQIQAENLGEESGLDGGYTVGTDREIFGPYKDVPTGPMRNHVNYTPGFGEQIQDSGLCATCHTLFTPIVDAEGNTTGMFPEQVPYLEWLNSAYPSEDRHCQDCHMPRLDEPIKITARPPWIGTREPFWRHTFTGANSFMRKILADPEDGMDVLADPETLQRQIEGTREFLREQTARLTVTSDFKGTELHLVTQVENLAGHKFPTGYPARRAWLRVEICDEEGHVLFLSGDHDEKGRLIGESVQGFYPHLLEISDAMQVQVYQAVMGDQAGTPTTHLLRAAVYLKDNRILPRGYAIDGPQTEMTAPRGAASADPDYADGKGADRTLYRIALPENMSRFHVRVDLLYQSVPPEEVDELISRDLPAAADFAERYRRADHAPVIVQSVEIEIDLPE
jgi:hypothetical protein